MKQRPVFLPSLYFTLAAIAVRLMPSPDMSDAYALAESGLLMVLCACAALGMIGAGLELLTREPPREKGKRR